MGVIYREGSTIGAARSSSSSAANGLWRLYEAEDRNRNGTWPVQLVKSSLVFNIDAAIKESYAGTGTTWADISGAGVSASTGFATTPTYSTDNGGYFALDGVNSAGMAGVNFASNNFSIDLWVKPTAMITVNTQSTSTTTGASGQRYVTSPIFQTGTDSGAGISLGTNGISVYEHASGYLPPLLSHTVTISSTVFSHIVVVYTSKQPSLYINNSFIKSGLTSPKTNVYCAAGPGEFIGSAAYGKFTGHVAAIKIYSKSLTATEVAQNFNAYRNRYGV